MRGSERSEIGWSDDKGEEEFEVKLPERPMPHKYGLHVAVEVTARVRTQTLMEGLYGVGGAIHVDTDGLIVPADSPAPPNYGPAFGQWQVKEDMRTVDLRAPQLYRFQRETEDYIDWHYVASGLTPAMARRVFEKTGVSTTIAYLNMTDKCLPPVHNEDELMMFAIYQEAERLGVM